MVRAVSGRMTCFGVVLLAFCLVGDAQAADEDELRVALAAYVEAFNQQDLERLNGYWAAEATHLDRQTTRRTAGREAILADIAAVLGAEGAPRLSAEITFLQFVRPDVAKVEGRTTLMAANGPPAVSDFSALLTKQDDHWQFTAVEEMPVSQPTTPYDALRPLEWLVGQWVDSSDTVRVHTTFRWSSQQAYLIRSYVVVQQVDGEDIRQEGTQVIGWDPRQQRIRSWKFDSDGSFGSATWTQDGEEWLIRSEQTLADGRTASGTYVLTRLDRDTMTLRLMGHEVDGEPVPSVPPVKVVRVPEDPADIQ